MEVAMAWPFKPSRRRTWNLRFLIRTYVTVLGLMSPILWTLWMFDRVPIEALVTVLGLGFPLLVMDYVYSQYCGPLTGRRPAEPTNGAAA
jgi:hypothetical protein